MIVWRGWGLLTVAIAVAALAAVDMTTGPADAWSFRAKVAAVLLIGAAMNLWLGRRLNAAPARVLIDKATARRIVVRPRHDLFFVPMEWWSAAFALGAAAVAFNAA
jgi:hypothetical protein